jgi:IclR family pca regulon transcriptional regulator
MADDDSDREFVTALARGMRVLEVFEAEHPALTLSEVAAATDLNPATARRSLLTLERLGYVRQMGRRFELTAKVLSLGASYFASLDPAGVAHGVLHELAEELQHGCSVTVLDGNDVVYVAHVTGAGPVLARTFVGSRLPAHATSTGHVLLAHLPESDRRRYLAQAPFARYTANTPTTADELHDIFERVQQQGYAAVSDTVEYGAAAVAVAIRGRDGVVCAALNSSASSARERDQQTLLDRIDVLHAAARRLEQALVRFPTLAWSA